MSIQVEVEFVSKTAFAADDGYFLTAKAHGHTVRVPLDYEAVLKLAQSIQEATEEGSDLFRTPILRVAVENQR